MNDTENKLTHYLKKKYNPLAIVLHGSRANGMAREHSDWDIAIITEKKMRPRREVVYGANIELKEFILPLPEDTFLGFFFRTENTKILFDTDAIAQNLILKNDLLIKEGNLFDQTDCVARCAFLLSSLDGIQDYASEPLILFDKKIDFYTRIVDSWFRFKKNEFEPSHYYAFPIIQKEDPAFYSLIEQFVGETSSHTLIEICNKIIHSLFPDLK